MVDTETGEVVAHGKPSKGRQTLIERGHKFEPEPMAGTLTVKFPYTEGLVVDILDEIREGKTVTEIGKLDKMPPAKYIRWMMGKYPEFKAWADAAKQDRAEFFHDKIEELARLTTNDNARPNTLKLKAYMWLAQVGNPKEFAPKPQEQNKGNITFIINTGVPDAKPIEAKSTWKSDELVQDTPQENSSPKSSSTKNSNDSAS